MNKDHKEQQESSKKKEKEKKEKIRRRLFVILLERLIVVKLSKACLGAAAFVNLSYVLKKPTVILCIFGDLMAEWSASREGSTS
jgi:hypothetical protein